MTRQHENVKRIEYGEGILRDALAGVSSYVVVSMEVPWSLARPQVAKEPEQVFLIPNVQETTVEKVIAEAPETEWVVGIGGGQAIDVAKYLAFRRGAKLINVPTIVSTNAYVTPLSGIRRGDRVDYIGGIAPELVVVDYSLIRTAPKCLNVAGAGDVLSMHTASFDWEIAARAGEKAKGRTYEFNPEAVKTARAILAEFIAGAEEIGKVTNEGIKLIVDSYLRINDLCLPLGHFRPEEGSEHFFAYNAEHVAKHEFLHGAIVGLGIVLMSAVQGNDPKGIRKVLDTIGLDYSPAASQLTREQVITSLATAKEYALSRNLWYSVIDEANLTEASATALVNDLGL
ncbi:MAG: iron-containing alcohol dehydrogenase [Bacillota bacterium]|nr:iron-containing alcohol dehydrogenase [Bacillota bacterium]